MEKGKQLAKNSMLYAIGNFGSKILTFLIVPLYTYYIDTSEMGVYDAIVTAVSLCAPVLVLSIYEGIYRWCVKDINDAGKYIQFGLKYEIRNLLICTAIYLIVGVFISIPYFWIILIYTVSLCIHNYVNRVTRALGNTVVVAVCGITYTVIYLALNILLIIVMKKGIEAFFWSAIIGNIVTSGLMLFKQRGCIFKKNNLTPISRDERLQIIKYSAAVTPNDICWWIVGLSDRFALIYFVSTSANGLYAISQKFPTVVTMITTIFYMAWQDQAVSTFDETEKDAYYTNVFKLYSRLLLCGVICLIPATKYVILWFMEKSYHTAWYYVMPLYVGTVYSALASFLGVGYQGAYQNTRALITTGVAALVNMGINLLFIPSFPDYGIWIASVSTMISYMVLFGIRFVHSRRYFYIKVKWMELVCLTVISIVLGIAILWTSLLVDAILFSITLLLLVFINRDYIRLIVGKLKRR